MGFIQEIEETETKFGNVFITDISPPKGVNNVGYESIININSDFLLIIDSPGGSVRSAPIPFAYKLSYQENQNVIFTLNCRDMNKLAIQSNLLGAQMLNLNNVFVVNGDKSTKQKKSAKTVNDYTTTTLISDIVNLNHGMDFQQSKLDSIATFTVGSAIDFSKVPQINEIKLVRKKITNGTDFFISQPCYDTSLILDFHKAYYSQYGYRIDKPIFYGVQMLSKTGRNWGFIPEDVENEMKSNVSSLEIALKFVQELLSLGFNNIYLVPPIENGGVRDYYMAQLLIKKIRSM
ncbi:MAG: hypothetical protein FI695_01920 [SAR202 cluster bacterium]|nr:hypothetical protein [Chloroflexota bacterium]MQG50721.1 hypothetical protein [SAR202 cluster bacterium]|tara:strand:+ start:429 stop:1301 length:873 start_codon:yes stop_codon:yes gene_type:complete